MFIRTEGIPERLGVFDPTTVPFCHSTIFSRPQNTLEWILPLKCTWRCPIDCVAMYLSGVAAHIIESPKILISQSSAFDWFCLQKDLSAVPPAGEWQLRVCAVSVMDRVGPLADAEPGVMLSLPGHFRSGH